VLIVSYRLVESWVKLLQSNIEQCLELCDIDKRKIMQCQPFQELCDHYHGKSCVELPQEKKPSHHGKSYGLLLQEITRHHVESHVGDM